MRLRGYLFLQLYPQKAGLLKCPKGPVLENLLTVNMLKGPKHCINLHGSIFVRFFDYSENESA